MRNNIKSQCRLFTYMVINDDLEPRARHMLRIKARISARFCFGVQSAAPDSGKHRRAVTECRLKLVCVCECRGEISREGTDMGPWADSGD